MRSLLGMVEALLFVSGDPLTIKDLVKATEWDEDAVTAALHELQQRYAASDGGLQCTEVANGWQMTTKPDYAHIVGKLLAPNANRLSKAALEVVTIVAYRQPCTSADIEAIRGVSSDGVLRTLVERELVADVGRRQTPGRPILYGTTDLFLHYFGLASIDALPALPDDPDAEAAAATETAVVKAGGLDL